MASSGVLRLSLLWILSLLSLSAAGVGAEQSQGQQEVLKEHHARRVAIIGAGSAGSSAAYYVNKYSSEWGIETDITVFERLSYIGGRSTTVSIHSDPLEPVEVGGSIFVEVNRNLVAAAKELGLETNRLSETRLSPEDGGSPERLGVWNGQEFLFTQSDSSPSWWNTAKLLWKYGMAPIRTRSLMRETVGKFLQMYEAPHFPFRSISRVALDLGLTAVTGSTGEQYLAEHKITPPFATDIVQASTRVNYAQNLPLIHGLETMVCMATDGAMSIKGGNWQIFAGMVGASGATARLNTSVTDVYQKPDGTFDVFSKSANNSVTPQEQPASESFDAVILAAPLQYSQLSITPGPEYIPDAVPYVTLHVTLFTSPYKLSPSFFNLPPSSKVPNVVLTTLGPDDEPGSSREGVGTPGFFSISMLRTVAGAPSSSPAHTRQTEYLYKIFSPQELNTTYIHSLLDVNSTNESSEKAAEVNDPTVGPESSITWLHKHQWHSYPYLYPRVTFDDPELSPAKGSHGGGLWYTSGIESFISTMETSSLMGMNVARLIVDKWAGV